MTAGPNPSSRGVVRMAFALLGLLLVQVLLGTATNLYVTIPTNLAPGAVWPWVFTNAPLLAAHAVMALLILATSIGVVVAARRSPGSGAVSLAWLTLIGAVAALISGGVFLFFGQNNGFSLGMEAGFAVCIGATAALLYTLGTRERTARAGPSAP
ncbi:MAG: hypothetical protein QXG65_02220 [Thermoplasmata archaeon]